MTHAVGDPGHVEAHNAIEARVTALESSPGSGISSALTTFTDTPYALVHLGVQEGVPGQLVYSGFQAQTLVDFTNATIVKGSDTLWFPDGGTDLNVTIGEAPFSFPTVPDDDSIYEATVVTCVRTVDADLGKMVGVLIAAGDGAVHGWSPSRIDIDDFAPYGQIRQARFFTQITWRVAANQGPTMLTVSFIGDLLSADARVRDCSLTIAKRGAAAP